MGVDQSAPAASVAVLQRHCDAEHGAAAANDGRPAAPAFPAERDRFGSAASNAETVAGRFAPTVNRLCKYLLFIKSIHALINITIYLDKIITIYWIDFGHLSFV
jgi:hypothetical protein